MKTTYKQYTAKIDHDPSHERKMMFTISTAAVDRDGDTIDPKGWDLTNYMKNPTVLWAHDYSQPPVGKAVSLKATETGLHAEVEFLPKGTYPFADMIHDMCKDGFLNATSVGFRGQKYDKAKDREYGVDFKGQELLEFSIVPVPSNPEALAQRGVDGKLATKYAKQLRDWSHAYLGEQPPQMSEEQFGLLAVAMVKAMRNDPSAEKLAKEDEEDKPTVLNIDALAVEVAKILSVKKSEPEISEEVLHIRESEPEIDWSGIVFPKKADEVSGEDLDAMLVGSMRETFREMARASAQAAIKRMTGRLD